MSSTYPQRVEFEDHRFVRAIDLEDEQLYHLQRRWQHNLGLHSWGILCGLEVRNIGGTLRQPVVIIHKGMALDGYGRELVVTDVLRVLRPDETLDPAVTYDVWLTYNVGIDNGGTNPVDDCTSLESDCCCSPPDMNLRRIVEQPQILRLHTSARQSGSVTQPREVPAGDLDFSPERPMKFDAASQWPVFLCKLECNGTVWNVDSSERHYGGLQGLNKKETADKHGEAKVLEWRRSYDIPPPPLELTDDRHPRQDARYRDLAPDVLPATESLKEVVARMLPYWYDAIAPEIRRGRQVGIVAHGNSLRALVKHLDHVSEAEIVELNIPTAIPLVYELDDDLKAIRHYYLGDPEAAKRAAEAVAKQASAGR